MSYGSCPPNRGYHGWHAYHMPTSSLLSSFQAVKRPPLKGSKRKKKEWKRKVKRSPCDSALRSDLRNENNKGRKTLSLIGFIFLYDMVYYYLISNTTTFLLPFGSLSSPRAGYY